MKGDGGTPPTGSRAQSATLHRCLRSIAFRQSLPAPSLATRPEGWPQRDGPEGQGGESCEWPGGPADRWAGGERWIVARELPTGPGQPVGVSGWPAGFGRRLPFGLEIALRGQPHEQRVKGAGPDPCAAAQFVAMVPIGIRFGEEGQDLSGMPGERTITSHSGQIYLGRFRVKAFVREAGRRCCSMCRPGSHAPVRLAEPLRFRRSAFDPLRTFAERLGWLKRSDGRGATHGAGSASCFRAGTAARRLPAATHERGNG